MEVQAINMEKKRLMSHWHSSLAGLKQRDEAYNAAQELLRFGSEKWFREPPQIIWAGWIQNGAGCLPSHLFLPAEDMSGRTGLLLQST